MKKEVLIAIIIGFTLGLIITIGIYTAQRSINQRDQMRNPQPTQVLEESDQVLSHSLDITSPKNYAITNVSPTTITGITTPNSMIAALSFEAESLSTADSQGNFSVDVNIEAGENIIQITSYDQSGNFTQQEISVIFSTASLDISTSPEEEESDEE